MKKFIILLLIGGSIAYSYYYSEDVYRFYLKTYYKDYKKKSESEHLNQARQLYGEKKYKELHTYLKKAMILYPDSIEFMSLKGKSYIKMGKRKRGVDILMAIHSEERVPDEFLEISMKILYDQGMYRDILDVMKNRASDNPNVLYYHGVSLYTYDKFGKARHVLKMALNEGRTDYKNYYYIGMANRGFGDMERAVYYLEQALDMRPRDRDAAKALAGIYKKRGDYSKAARIMRRSRG